MNGRGKKVGFIAIIGFPNAGKSTLLNAILKQKISIMSPRPQTTRYRIEGIYTTERSQIIFVDTPGFIRAETGLNHILQTEIEEAISNSDAVLILIEPENLSAIEGGDEIFKTFFNKVRQLKKPFLVALNKIDTLKKDECQQYLNKLGQLSQSGEVIPVSALKNENLDSLVSRIEDLLPEGEYLYDPEQIAIKSERFLCQEMIREQLFYLLHKEIPYECAVTIEEFDESERYNEDPTKGIVRISAVIYVARESLKPILIGKDGSMIKKIGTMARANIENFLGCKIFLSLRVVVKKNWNKDRFFLYDLGYKKV